MTETRPEPPSPEMRTAWAFRVALAVFLVAACALARVNRSPGSADSCGNLVGARNIVLGRGFVSTAAGSLWVFAPLPIDETTRPPALPYLLAAAFALVGVSLAVPVAVNAAAVGLNAWLLRRAVGRTCGGRLGDLAGLLVLVSYDYELVSVWNNNILAACTSGLLLVGTRRGGSTLLGVVSLAAWSAFGFLMKPTYLLSALPFSCLVLGADGGKTRSRRAAEMAVYLALFAAGSSVYWGRNLGRYGAPLHSPSFTSGRLAERYGVLGADSWRTVRFGRPMTYAEVARRLGWAGLLIADAKMVAKTVFYSVCLNPAVAACAAGLVLFGRAVRWRDYAGPALLISGVVFEVGVYNHHEFRYLWPIYPCLLALAGLTVRDFAEWGAAQMTPTLAGRFLTLFALLGGGALLIGTIGALETWRQAYRTARQPPPEWIGAVRRLPEGAVVLTPDVPSVAWWADRRAVMCPVGGRDDLSTVVRLYRADHYLALGEGDPPGGKAAFLDAELTPVDRGEGWALSRINGPIESAPRPPPQTAVIPAS